MSNDLTERTVGEATPPSANHFVAPLEETPLLAIDVVKVADKPSNLWIDAWRDARRRPIFWISGFFIHSRVRRGAVSRACSPTSLPNNDCQLINSNGGPTSGHILGFTKQGCDVYSRIINGTSTSLSVGIIVIVLTTVLGIVFGAFAGFYGGVSRRFPLAHR